MKRILLVLSLFLAFSLGVFAQNIVLIKGGNNLANGAHDTVSFIGSSTLVAHVDVKNVSASTLNIKCRRTMLQEVPGSTNSICWGGSCWPVTTSVTPPTTIAANTISTEFVGDYKANSTSGETIIRYTFFNEANANDTVCYIAHFLYFLSLNENENVSFSDAYPNPANNVVSFNYDLGSAKDAKIMVRDLLGKELLTSSVTEKEGKHKLATDQLLNGIYFYSLIVDNKVLYTKKLIIRHQ